MKIRRFVARDMKTALAQIKEELGADAVIMSNKKIPEGVELMAAVDYASQGSTAPSTHTQVPTQNQNAEPQLADDSVQLSSVVSPISSAAFHGNQTAHSDTSAPVDSLSALLNRQAQAAQAGSTPSQKPEVSTKKHSDTNTLGNISDIEQQFKDFTDRLEQTTQNSTQPQFESSTHTQNDTASNIDHGHAEQDDELLLNQAGENVQANASSAYAMDEISRMQKEMSSIRKLLENQVSGLMWQDMAQRDPRRAYLVNRLTDLGLTEQLADQISGCIPPEYNEDDAWSYAKSLMAKQLNTTQNEIVHRGGVFSLVGPTGVGKTTTIAKLAARFAQIHGADQVVLISTDNYRIAGFEQLSTYGRIIGCQVKQAHDEQALDTMLQQYAKKKLILIDTAGMGQRDMRLVKNLTTLVSNARIRIRNYLVLSANTQQRVMQENVERFKAIPLSGCIFTKLDESLSAGELIATSMQNALPIGYLTDGQRVPEDIKVANTEKLVTLADAMTRKYNPAQKMVKQTVPSMHTAFA